MRSSADKQNNKKLSSIEPFHKGVNSNRNFGQQRGQGNPFRPGESRWNKVAIITSKNIFPHATVSCIEIIFPSGPILKILLSFF